MQVLVVAFACCPPSGGRFTGGEDLLGWSLVRQIARFHDVWVVTDAALQSDIETALAESPAPRTRFVYVALPRWLVPLRAVQGGVQLYTYLWQLQALRVARRLAQEHRFHLAHHLTYANDWMASPIGAFLDIPYLRGPGGGAHRIPEPFLSEFTFGGRLGERLRALLQGVFRRDPIFVRSQERARRLLVCNREALEALPPTWRQKAVLFPVNGVNTEDVKILNDESLARDRSGLTVLCAGKLLRLKGWPLAIRAFQRFCVQYPASRLELIGDGPDRDHLLALVRRLGLQERVQLSPWVTRAEFLRRLAACDVFLFPSLRDGGGAVVVEAMAAGKPVICFNLGGPALHVDATCGVKIEAGSPQQAVEDLAKALARLVQEEERERLGRAARARVEACYYWDRLGDRLAEIYRQVTGPSSTGIGQLPDDVASSVVHVGAL